MLIEIMKEMEHYKETKKILMLGIRKSLLLMAKIEIKVDYPPVFI